MSARRRTGTLASASGGSGSSRAMWLLGRRASWATRSTLASEIRKQMGELAVADPGGEEGSWLWAERLQR
eukprot:1219437-Alexandrium_andersonii.AAC.1